MTKSVIVVEDEPFIAELLEFLLSDTGRSVRVLNSGTQARACFGAAKLSGENSPDLVVLDLMMPDDDGEQIFQDLLKPGSGWIAGRPKVMVLSAIGQAPVRDRLLAAGVDAFVTKPFDNEALLATVERLCGESR